MIPTGESPTFPQNILSVITAPQPNIMLPFIPGLLLNMMTNVRAACIKHFMNYAVLRRQNTLGDK